LSLESRRAARLEDPGAELIDRVTGFWGQFGRIAAIVLGVIVLVGVGVFFMMRGRAASENQAAGRLAEASLYFWQGDYVQSEQIAKQVAEQFPQTPSGIDAHRLLGDDLFWQGKFKEAIAEYRRFLDKRKTGLIADAVRRSLAYALESDLQHQEAMTTYLGLVGAFDRESSAEFLMAASRCAQALKQPQEAQKHLQRLVDEFGETSYANRARMELAAVTLAPR